MDTVGFFTILLFSFTVALTGAMAPGPLLTYTIIKSARARKRGYAMGLWIIIGHAIIEGIIIVLLLAGLSVLLREPVAVKTIGVIGGTVLVLFGISIIRDIVQEKLPVAFEAPLEKTPGLSPGVPDDATAVSTLNKIVDNPVIGGALISMANPYWWVWWATIGFAFMTQFDVSLTNIPALAAFFIGHEAGDLAWYLLVSTLSFWGVRRLNKKVYYGLLGGCAVFMMGFGVYLGVSPFF
jgi:threonine/homoserine/homoserine lactone efflux protein